MNTAETTLVYFFLLVLVATGDESLSTARPDPSDAPAFARWLVRESSWGVLTTLDSNKAPFGNILSFTDVNSTGIPYFYQSRTLDPTGMNAVNDSRVSFTLTEYVLGYCHQKDPQDPECAKINLSGNLKVLDKSAGEGKTAEAALIATHPSFAGFPKLMNFDVFKLIIEKIFLVNELASPKYVSVEDYFYM